MEIGNCMSQDLRVGCRDSGVFSRTPPTARKPFLFQWSPVEAGQATGNSFQPPSCSPVLLNINYRHYLGHEILLMKVKFNQVPETSSDVSPYYKYLNCSLTPCMTEARPRTLRGIWGNLWPRVLSAKVLYPNTSGKSERSTATCSSKHLRKILQRQVLLTQWITW